MREELLYLWYGMMSRMTNTVKMNIVMHYGGLGNLWEVSESQLREDLTAKQADAILEYRNEALVLDYREKLRKDKVEYIYPGHPAYPVKLYDIPDPPLVLFARGDIELLKNDDKAVAVVGARKASVYGRTVADRFVSDMVCAGVTIVSGMALGIDGMAHRAALKAGGRSVAVLGCGINVVYPKENYDIYHDICSGGGVVLSESGLDVKPDAFRFPYRNRIISGLADGVLVVEAREKSGSLITADQALEQGRDVYVIPGRVTDSGSAGCNNLIRMGAECVMNAGDILESLGLKEAVYRKNTDDKLHICGLAEPDFNKNLLAPTQKKVYSCVRLESRHVDDICMETGISVSEVTQILYDLERMGLVKQLMRNYYTRV